ncbi:toll/interleukin-1 receptor domain-containing protein [Bradyrhizobium sp. 18]|uniref:toll/interleukin-1 receptor domain-containing protein n=1 Tax=Bradyrhizobium sp. 18 TaxID=2782657 RepID=UPI001FFB7D48|nr:toll/interleukin-1 receptor domain-containing protein [Bradyrhizobium sp. 18]MCK1506837.1 toll/interleukin-1 receptor domain-containing protein [Bradyrhizobium sp. 18]
MNAPLVFVSHAEEDKDVAICLKSLILEAAGAPVEVYVSSDADAQRHGADWFKQIREKLSEAAAIVFLASSSSLKANWALFEIGAAFFSGPEPKIIPICISGLTIARLPDPFSRINAADPTTPQLLRRTVGSIFEKCAVPFTDEELDWNQKYVNFRSAQEEWLVVEHETFAACSFDTLERLEPLLPVRPGQTERLLYGDLIGLVLQKMTFHGSPIDDRFWALYGNAIREKSDWTLQKKLAYAVSTARIGKIVTGRKETYDVMDILRRQVTEYRATATDEELFRPESQKFLFASAEPAIFRLFILREGKATFANFDEDQRRALDEQLKGGVQIRILKWEEESPPPNFGIYGDVAVGRLSPTGVNEIVFHTDAVKTCRQQFEALWQRGEKVT